MKSFIQGKTGVMASAPTVSVRSTLGRRLGDCPDHVNCPAGYTFDAMSNLCVLAPAAPVMVLAGKDFGKRW